MITETAVWSPQVQGEVVDRLRSPGAGRWLAQVQQVRSCAHPVRLCGGSDRIDAVTGEVVASYTSSTEPDGLVYVRCGNRRRAVCPSCSHEYQGDAWHVIMAGAVGGMKDVPESVATHPLVFVTLTAPSFGAVHTAKKPGRAGSRRCRPRSGAGRRVCPHGRPTWCMATHQHGDQLVGQPLCADCYDYAGHLVWQWHAPELWRRFTIRLRRLLAQHLGRSEEAAKRLVRVQFAKVAEFQQRGLIHFHGLIRLDGPPTDDEAYPAALVDVDPSVLGDLLVEAAKAVSCLAAPVDSCDVARLLRFGGQVDARPIRSTADRDDADGGQLHPETVAAYVAKYATKAAGDIAPGGNPHLARLRATVDRLAWRASVAGLCGADGPYRNWGRWVTMLGFRGHFHTKSRRFSTTFGQLRQARRDHATGRECSSRNGHRGELAGEALDDDQAETVLVVGSWRFVGMGWLTTGDAALAAASAARARDA